MFLEIIILKLMLKIINRNFGIKFIDNKVLSY
mgnify:CR=1 FL=1